MKKIYQNILSAFSLDLRSLALARIFLGIFVLKESIEMIPYVKMFYTKEGFLPRNLFLTDFAHDWTYSLFYISDSPLIVYLLYAVFILVNICFIIGYRTKLSTILMWFFVLSLHNRNWGGLNGGDDLVRCALLIMIFLPLNRRFSFDSALSPNRITGNEYTSFWNFVLFFQLAIMYISSAYFKTSPIWHTDFSALEFALSLEAFTRPLGRFLLNFPGFLALMTFIVFWAEKFLCWFIFLGYSTKIKPFVRTFLVFFWINFHLGIFVLMNVGNFPLYAVGLWLAWLPPQFWNLLARKIKTNSMIGLQIYYDAECGFCKKLVYLMREFFLVSETKIETAQSSKELEKLMKKNNSWVVKNAQGNLFQRFDGVIEVLKNSPVLKYFVFILNLKPVYAFGNASYQLVANNRKRLSFSTRSLNFKQLTDPKISFVTEVFGIFIALTISYWPLSGLNVEPFASMTFLQKSNRWLHTYQNWKLFAPYPKNVNDYFMFKGILPNGEIVDLQDPSTLYRDDWSERSIASDKRADIVADRLYVKSIRKLFMRLIEEEKYRKVIAEYYCKDFEQEFGLSLKKVEIHRYYSRIFENHAQSPVEHELLYGHNCP